MLRRLPPIVQFIFISMIGIFIGTVVGLVSEFLQKPFNATDAVVWLFLMLISGVIITVIVLFGRNKLG
jgi:ABC-type transporter Mla maintaining outer membrane lipid asymmetry permease subunit MlaE